jgi:HCOMODA/2-hydroxy-3-carboxy-muconic semialdehyde decarboxylase
MMSELASLLHDLAIANRILAREDVVDAFGHVSVRHPEHPERYILSRSRSPALVTRGDLVDFTLEGAAVDPSETRSFYIERPIHGAIYEARPDVQAVIHNHAYAVIPFAVTPTPLRPILHVAGGIGATIPVWDIRAGFGDTNLLVTTMAQGRDLAATLGEAAVALMRGHGCVVAAATLKQAVTTAIYLQVNAALLLDALKLGEVSYLSPGEIEATAAMTNLPVAVERTWEYWAARADTEGV